MQLFRQSSLLFLIWYISCSPPKTIYDNSGSFTIKKNINELISLSGLDASMGIKIVSLETGKTLYSLNSKKLLMPASNIKLYTCAAALEELGSDYRFKTIVLQNGNNLILKGGGDPNLAIDQLDSLVKITIKNIDDVDTLFVDESLLDSFHYGQGWMWDEGSTKYSAPISAITINKNCVDFFVKPGKTGGKAIIDFYPRTKYINVNNSSLTVKDTIDFEKFRIDRDWAGRTNHFNVSGNILYKSSIDTFQRNIFDPVLFCGTIFKEQLNNYGINVKNMVTLKQVGNASPIAVHTSAPLLHSAYDMMHESDNLTAELFTKILAVNDTTTGSWKYGLQKIKTLLADSSDIDTSLLQIADGSGFSRYNLSSANHIVKFLSYMYTSKHKDDFIFTLAGDGSNSTLKNRLKFANSKIRAKTGHLSGVSCLSGYIYSDKYGPLAFSILMNGFTGKAKPYQRLQDKIINLFLHD